MPILKVRASLALVSREVEIPWLWRLTVQHRLGGPACGPPRRDAGMVVAQEVNG